MESRVDKHFSGDNSRATMSRSNRNARLYQQIEDNYQDFDNLPVESNTNEIDMEKLKEMLNKKEEKKRTFTNEIDLELLEKKKSNISDKKIYDINKLLEKAKYENNKIKEPENKIMKNSKSILSTLEGSELSISDIKRACQKYDEPKEVKVSDINLENNMDNENEKQDELSLTREMKYRTRNISLDPMINQVMPDNDLSLDLLSDLKPTENTIVTKPITDSTIQKHPEEIDNSLKDDNQPSKQQDFFPKNTDTSDIDVIKEQSKVDSDFFTSSYHFSKKDFTDDDFFDEKDGSNIGKIVLLVCAILIFLAVIYYFITNFVINK